MNFRRIFPWIGNLVLPVLVPLSLAVSPGFCADDVALKKGAPAHKWELTSKAFKEGDTVPKEHTADGKDISPALTWTAPPAETKSIALICDDPDAPKGTWVHWVIFDIPAGEKTLAEALPADKKLKNGTKQGNNSFNKVGYNGPSPPPGKPHRYFFKIYALDKPTGLAPGAKKEQLLAAMKDHVLSQATLMGTYGR